MRPLTPGSLLLSNLRRRRFRTAALVLLVAAVTGGVGVLSLLVRGIGRGVALGTARFGADLVVIPRGGRAAIEGALIVGQPTQITLPGGVLAAVRKLPGVQIASPQIFVQSLHDASCCPGEFFLIGYDPATDLTVKPWLEEHHRTFGDHDALVGDRVSLKDGAQLPFFGTPFTIAGRLAPTGVGLDTTVFIPLAGVRDMVLHSPERAEQALHIKPDEISAVMVRVAPGTAPTTVAEEVTANIDNVEVLLAPQEIAAAVRELGVTLKLLMAVAAGVWLLLFPVLGITFAMTTSERRRDLGLHRALGATSKVIFRLAVAEAGLITGLGGLLGLGSGLVVLLLFNGPLGRALQRPYVPAEAWSMVGFFVGLELAAVATGALAAWLPARAAAAADPYVCLRQGEA
ncbi:MAG: ABC transporter permease [Armatimonadetes bacterium]|nr:ABC transporter permease [Armatimonadota bacterium]